MKKRFRVGQRVLTPKGVGRFVEKHPVGLVYIQFTTVNSLGQGESEWFCEVEVEDADDVASRRCRICGREVIFRNPADVVCSSTCAAQWQVVVDGRKAKMMENLIRDCLDASIERAILGDPEESYARPEVFEMVGALFDMYASSYRDLALETLEAMMALRKGDG